MIPMMLAKSADITSKATPTGATLGFGRVFTAHMLLASYEPASGWRDAQLVPYGPLSLDPTTMALHYGQNVPRVSA